MTERGRNNKNYLRDQKDFKIDIDYPKLLTRSKSLRNKETRSLLGPRFDIIKEEKSEDEKDTDRRHFRFIHKGKTFTDFYKIHHKNILDIDKINPNEDLVTSEYFKSFQMHKSQRSSCSATTFDEISQDKEDKTEESENLPKKIILDTFQENFSDSNILENSEKTINKNPVHTKYDYEEIEVIKEDLNENDKLEENV
jgi:hypothetical protein